MLGCDGVRGVLAWLMVCGVGAAPLAAAPWDTLKLFKRVEADENGDYRVTEEQGPWMILAVTFMGETAEKDARDLVFELRRQHHLEAYLHKAHFDFTGTVAGRGLDESGRPRQMRYRRDAAYDEVAVLVGNYRSVDDPEGQETLKKLKYMWPVCMRTEKGKVSRPLAGWREFKRRIDEFNKDEQRGKGPLGHAFLVTNPLLPREYFVPKGIDRFVLELNKDVPYSLLSCPGRYTVRVATFTGHSVIQAMRAEGKSTDLPRESQLEKAGQMAHVLTEYLRSKGWEAYQFHDRYSSMVTVGSFHSVGTPRPDGKIEINPAIHKIMQTFAPAKTPAGVPVKQRTLTGMKIPLDLQPMPVEVPRRSVAVDYGQARAGW